MAAEDGDSVTLTALGVPVGVPAALAADYAAFPRSADAAAIVLRDRDPLALSAAFTRSVAERTAYLAVHAGAVAYGRRAVVIPAPSGAGKSTLVAALVGAGFAYLTDEMVGIGAAAEICAFPRPVSLDARSCALLGLPHAGDRDEVTFGPHTLGAIGPERTTIGSVLLLERGTALSIDIASGGAAAAALLAASFNHFRRPRSSLAAIGAAVRSATVFQVGYSNAPELAAALRARLLDS